MKFPWTAALLIFLLILIGVDIAMRIILWPQPEPSSRCLALPTRFVLDYPECADKLIQAVNMTNIHIVPFDRHILQQQDYVNRLGNISVNRYAINRTATLVVKSQNFYTADIL